MEKPPQRPDEHYRERYPNCGIDRMTGVYMWVVNRNLNVVAITPDALEATGDDRDWLATREAHEYQAISSLETEARIYRLQRVFETGKADTVVLWEKTRVRGWIKMIMTSTMIDDDYVLTVAHDLTHNDPRSEWLNRINLKRQVLHLGERFDGIDLRFDELRVLGGLIINTPYKVIAERLGISESTVTYRAKRLKAAFRVRTVPQLLQEVGASGLIYLFALDIDDAVPLGGEADLFRQVDPPPHFSRSDSPPESETEE